jgi:hypothetical protein
MRNSFRAALIASCGKSLLVNGVDGNIKTLISLLDGVQVPSYCYENPGRLVVAIREYSVYNDYIELGGRDASYGIK